MRLKLLSLLFHHNDQETLDAIQKREQQLDDERRLTRMAKREAMDRLFAAMREEPDQAHQGARR